MPHTSVTMQPSLKCGAFSSTKRTTSAGYRQTYTTSAFSSNDVLPTESMAPRESASSRVFSSRSKPMTVCSVFSLRAFASEPPMRPRPMIAICISFSLSGKFLQALHRVAQGAAGVIMHLNDEAVCADGCRCHGKRLDKPVDAAGVAGVYDDGQVGKAL